MYGYTALQCLPWLPNLQSRLEVSCRYRSRYNMETLVSVKRTNGHIVVLHHTVRRDPVAYSYNTVTV
mgnify:FL=1